MAAFEWDGNKWEPNYAWTKHPKVHEWLKIHHDEIPKPRYNIGEMVAFVWSRGEIWRGRISNIVYGSKDIPGTPAYHMKPYITYTIYANGHARWVSDKDVL